MIGRAKGIEKIERELAELRERETKLTAEIERAEGGVASAQAQLAAAREAEGEAYAASGNADEARGKREEAERGVASARAELSRLASYRPPLARRIAEKQDELRRARAEALRKKCAETLAHRNAVASELGALLEQALVKVEERENLHRQATDDEEELGGLLGDEELPKFSEEHEPAWLPENAKELVEAIEKGPHQPRARSEAESEKLRRQRERGEDALVQDAVASFFSTAPPIPGEDDLRWAKVQALPEHLRPRAEIAIERRKKELAERRAAALATREPVINEGSGRWER